MESERKKAGIGPSGVTLLVEAFCHGTSFADIAELDLIDEITGTLEAWGLGECTGSGSGQGMIDFDFHFVERDERKCRALLAQVIGEVAPDFDYTVTQQHQKGEQNDGWNFEIHKSKDKEAQRLSRDSIRRPRRREENHPARQDHAAKRGSHQGEG